MLSLSDKEEKIRGEERKKQSWQKGEENEVLKLEHKVRKINFQRR